MLTIFLWSVIIKTNNFFVFPRTIKCHIYSQITMYYAKPYGRCLTFKLSKIIKLIFKLFLKLFASPLFTYNILLLFNFRCFLPFPCRALSKLRRCNFVLLQTLQCDVTFQRATTLILKSYRATTSNMLNIT